MLKRITFFVVSIHFLAVAFLLFSPAKKKSSKSKHVVVHMVTTAPKAVARVASPPPRAAAKPTSVAKPLAKKTESSKQAATTAPKPKPVAKKMAAVEKDKPKKTPPPKVWQEIDEALAKIDEKVYPRYQSKLEIPEVVVTEGLLQSDVSGIYDESLISFLHGSLNLPDHGEVKVQLTLRKDGSVAQLMILKAESKKNRDYLEKTLPLLTFPPSLSSDKTFTITFCNEL